MKLFIFLLLISVVVTVGDAALLNWVVGLIPQGPWHGISVVVIWAAGIWFTFPICLIPAMVGWFWYIKRRPEW